ncbi:MAG: electron transport complex subunit RsxE [Deltaproteobacteria bacterium]|nr:MAG: electron transport complex subunit RsxE [Deltaproteobacteria bacterium]
MGALREFTKGFSDQLPPFRLVLGLCPTLAVTTSASNGIGMGLATTFVLTFSNILVSLLRNIIPAKVRIACYIVLIATFVVTVELLLKAFFFPLYQRLGIFVALIVVNCIILGRAEAFASKNGILYSTLDGLGIGLGFTLSLTFLASIRELLGYGTIFGIKVMGQGFEPFRFFIKAPGAFVTLGILLYLMNYFRSLKEKGKI